MTLSYTFTESFVRGIGKSCGVVLVLGLVAGVYYVANSVSNAGHQGKAKTKGKENSNKEVQVQLTEMSDLENEAERVSDDSFSEENRFKQLFDLHKA